MTLPAPPGGVPAKPGDILPGQGAAGTRFWVVGCRHNLQRAIGHGDRERAELCAAGVRAGRPELVPLPTPERAVTMAPKENRMHPSSPDDRRR